MPGATDGGGGASVEGEEKIESGGEKGLGDGGGESGVGVASEPGGCAGLPPLLEPVSAPGRRAGRRGVFVNGMVELRFRIYGAQPGLGLRAGHVLRRSFQAAANQRRAIRRILPGGDGAGHCIKKRRECGGGHAGSYAQSVDLQ